MNIRLSPQERQALKRTFFDFGGRIFLFGSRTNPNKKGGDIDILLMPDCPQDQLSLKDSFRLKFQKELEQSIDIVIYDAKQTFCQEILKYATPINPSSL